MDIRRDIKRNNRYDSVNLPSLYRYSQFQSVAEMDSTVKLYNKSLKKMHYETLNLLKQYSCVHVGVSKLKIETIANALNKNARTIRRHIKLLETNGYINVIYTHRDKSGGNGANVFVINKPYKQELIKKSVNSETTEHIEADVLSKATEISNQYDKSLKDLVDR